MHPGKLLVIMSDTGDEHPRTKIHVKEIREVCEHADVEFYLITRDMGFHSKSWQSLTAQFRRSNSIGSVAMLQACTDQLKIRPIHKFLGRWLVNRYGCKQGRNLNITFDDFCSRYGKIRMLLGFAGGEERRIAKPSKWDAKWKGRCIQKEFPLIDHQIDRQGAQKIIRDYGYNVPPPSNCMRCFYMSQQELIWLYRNHRQEYDEWVELEQNKIEHSRLRGIPDEKNNGVFGKITIPEKLVQALEKYGDWTDEQLEDYKMNHGCVASKF